MALNIRLDGSVAILSNFARLMNDPRYIDAASDVHDLLDQGIRGFVIELAGVKETGSAFLGVLDDNHPRDPQLQGRGSAGPPQPRGGELPCHDADG